jgi:tyrosyl-tRNA synthetase
MRPFEEQSTMLRANTAEVVPSEEFEARLKEAVESNRPFRVKLGVDPTARDVTLGWTVVLRKLRQFQDLGHTAVLILGDFTARVGDPSGLSETRKPLSQGEVESFAEAVLAQLGRVLSPERLEIRRNSEWLAAMDMEAVIGLASRYTVARMLERDDFSDRYRQGSPISILEFLYPLLQGYDSVAVGADVELGGTDQHFNLMAGRDLQQRYGQSPQVVMTMPLIEGLDGVHKMSQSLGNYVAITEAPTEMFGKLMSLPDGLMVKYFRLTTDLPAFRVDEIEGALTAGHLHPAEAKRKLAWEIVRLYHGEEAADDAQERFDLVHQRRLIPEDVEELKIPADLVENGKVWIPRLLVGLGLTKSTSEGRRLMSQGGVRLEGRPLEQEEVAAAELEGKVLQVGRRSFVRLR